MLASALVAGCSDSLSPHPASSRSTALTDIVSSPLLWNIAVQTVGFITAAPLYFFAFFHAGNGGGGGGEGSGEGREAGSPAVPVAEAAALLPSLCIGYLLPTALLLWPGLSAHQRQLGIAIWQFVPLWFSLTQRLLARLMAPLFQPSPPSKQQQQQQRQGGCDELSCLRRTYNVMLGLSLLVHACALKFVFSTSDPLATLRAMFAPNLAPKGLAACAVALLQWDFLVGITATLGWAAGAVWQSTRPADRGLGRALVLGLGFVGGSLLASPAAVITAAFRWREEQLRLGY